MDCLAEVLLLTEVSSRFDAEELDLPRQGGGSEMYVGGIVGVLLIVLLILLILRVA